MYIDSNGGFRAECHSALKGIKGDDYRSGTQYESEFVGRFTNVKEIDAYSYSMTVSNVSLVSDTGHEEIINGKKYVQTDDTCGWSDGVVVTLYKPETPLDVLTFSTISLRSDCFL